MLTLRAYRETDAPKVASWLNDKNVFVWWSAGKLGDYPLEPARLNAFYAPGIAAGDWFPFVMEDDGEGVGQMLMRWKNKEAGWLHFGFIVVDGSRRGKGYGSGMLRLAFQKAFGELGASRVTLNVFEDNAPALRCYAALGFKQADEAWLTVGGESRRALVMEKRKES